MVDSHSLDNVMESRFGTPRVKYSARGIPTYFVEVFHDGLHKHQELRASDNNVLLNKAQAVALQWNASWSALKAEEGRVRQAHEAQTRKALHLQHQKNGALERTKEAEQIIESLRGGLAQGIEIDPTIDWEELKVTSPFSVKSPTKPAYPGEPARQELMPPEIPAQPDRSHSRYRPELSVLDHVIPSRKAAKLAALASQFEFDLARWRELAASLSTQYSNACAELSARHQAAVEMRRALCAKLDQDFATATLRWEEQKRQHTEDLFKQHQQVDQMRERYERKETDAIVEYCDRVLSRSEYPSFIPRECDLELNPETGVLLLNSRLPAPDDLPRLIEVKYMQAADTFKEVFLSDVQSAKLYDDVVYQITLRTLHELFQSDAVRAISTIVFNGFVTSTDKSTGNEATACILSVQASRDRFLAINLAKVDPKACFRQLKGVGSSKLHSVTPVVPIVELNRNDRRFVPSYGVADQLNPGYNLATMDWEDFEHLVREIFQKEFSSTGGEVKVTQASRDGGVDAVAFDPDPIRGGKIVIQAKRYAHTVGVSAVRDLFGTVMNEGASKGILVTTSDYGPDAYEFANGKPLTLLSGSNLLHLLAKHGVGAHIDLVEARKVAQERAAQARSQ
jgi:restriction system protein